ncbi:MAG: FlgD immunoglobulin-like domain containing protein [Chloroflexota bacterium]|nr:FlgD immunoglobulin-like domain containing protein [Chloroflexota bacterium]
MKTRFTQSNQRKSVPLRRLNVAPLLAILTIGAIVATLVLLFPMDWVRTSKVAVSAERTIFSPNEDGDADTALVMYSLSDDADVTVNVLDATHTAVRTLVDDESQAAGQHTVVWDGLDQMGQALPDGEYLVQVTAHVTVRSSASTIRLHIDTQPPIIRLANLPEDIEVGGDQSEMLIEGVTDPDATVWLNDSPQPLEVSTSGGFSVLYPLREGVNQIELTTVDQAGNRASVTREITLLTQPPDIVVLNPPDGLWINQQMLSVQGAVPNGTLVRVNRAEAAVDADGAFDVDVVLDEGENTITIEATDAVGNVTLEERRVYLRTRPPVLSLTTVQDGMTVREPSLLVVGKTEPMVNVRLNGREVAVDSQGGFQGVVDLLEGDNVVRVDVVGRAGNTAALARQVTYSLPADNATTPLPAEVRTVLAAAGAGIAGIAGLWLFSGLWRRPLSLVLRATRPTLSLEGDRWVKPAVVAFEISRPATITADVWDADNRHVITLFSRQRRDQGEHMLVWDGHDETGQSAPPGVYEVEVNANALITTVSGSTRLWVEEGPPRPTWERSQERAQRARYEQTEL